MPPLVDSQTILPESQGPVRSSTPRGPLTRAIDEYLLELKEKGDSKNPFLNELVKIQKQGTIVHDGVNQSDVSAEGLKNFVEDLGSRKLTSGGHRVLSRLTPFLSSLHTLMKVCESLLQASPLGVSVAFTGARVVIDLAIRMNTYAETVVDALDQISFNIACYSKFADAYQSSMEVQSQIFRSYKRIIEFWFNVSHTLSQHSLKVVLKSIITPLDKDIKTALDGLKDDSKKVQKISNAEEAMQSTKGRETARRRDIVRWINSDEPLDVRPDLKKQHDYRHEGTCEWLFQDEKFKSWRDNTKSGVLWYTSPPGSGKSVLSSAVIDHLTQRA